MLFFIGMVAFSGMLDFQCAVDICMWNRECLLACRFFLKDEL